MASAPNEIARIYREHPLRLDTILERVRRDRGTLDGLTESLLAIDGRTAVTDQNNVGGAAAVMQTARDAGVTRRSRVLDLGCGLGGPARLLADRIGCRVTGIDLSPDRVRDARELTRLVSLSDKVTINHGDMTRAPVQPQSFDVIWGQDAWMHVQDPAALIGRWMPALRSGGRLVVKDGCLRRAPRGDRETAMVRRLERDWSGTLWPAATWIKFVEAADLRVIGVRRSPRMLAQHFCRLIEGAARAGTRPPLRESRSWKTAGDAVDSGLLTYISLVAVRRRHRG